jgi:hypothetical protein
MAEAFTMSFDASKLLSALQKVGNTAAKELRMEMGQACRTVQRDAKMHHRYKAKRGGVERSILYDVSPAGIEGTLRVDTGVTPYAGYVHDGTKPHKIFPKNKAALYFVINGKKILVPKLSMLYGATGLSQYWREAEKAGAYVSRKGYVDHPGTKPDKFLYQAMARQKPYILARMSGAVKRVFQMAGFK